MDNGNEVVKKNHFFRNFVFILFFIFICLFIIKENGYLAHKMSNLTFNTEESIKKFENSDANIDESGYIKTTKINYANNVSRFGEKVSDTISFLAEKSISLFNGIMKYLFN